MLSFLNGVCLDYPERGIKDVEQMEFLKIRTSYIGLIGKLRHSETRTSTASASLGRDQNN